MGRNIEVNYPLLFEPVYKDYIWGGDHIARAYRKNLPPGVYAESWEIADRPEGMSRVVNGPLAGTTLHDAVSGAGPALLGSGRTSPVFPLLIKIIDSKQSLSVQVHPNDENAAALGGEAKTEMWYVLGAKSGARVFAGLKPGIGRPVFEKALQGLSLERLLVAIPAVADEAIFVPGGRVHSIGAGCLLLEVQQNSNTTYRVHDWGRVGKDGKPRELHIEQALRAIDWTDRGQARFTAGKAVQTGANSLRKVLDCKYFHVERLDLGKVMQLENDGGSFHAFFTVSGSVTIEAGGTAVKAPAGVSSLLAASVRRYTLTPESGMARVLRISLG